MIDGIDHLVALYGDQETFVEAFVAHTLFFPVAVVEQRNVAMIDLYRTGGKFPIRYSPAHNQVFHVQNKREAVALTRQRRVQLPLYPTFTVEIDPDGNAANRRLIKQYTGQTISAGQRSTIKNYIISHVWGEAGHPLFFSALWNIVLIPAHLNYLMDKDADSHPVVGPVKAAIRQRCLALYQPYERLVAHIPEIAEFRELFATDNGSISVDNVHFLVEQVPSSSEALVLTAEERAVLATLLNKMGKAFFVDHYRAFAAGEDLMNVVPTGLYTYNSLQTRISTMRKIFGDGLQHKALLYILEFKNSRLADETIQLIQELLQAETT